MGPEDLAARVSDLVCLPEVCLRVEDILRDEQATAEDLAEAILTDPGLTAKLLGMVNSAFYGLSRRVETVSHAVSLVGFEEIRYLVWASAAAEALRGLPVEGLNVDAFWRHCVFCGNAASALLGRRSRRGREADLVAGLLHDVGWLVLCHQVPDRTASLLEISGNGQGKRLVRERELFGFTHSEVGGALLRLWKLPGSLWMPVEFHHEPWAAPDHAERAARLHLANAAAAVHEPFAPGDADAPAGRYPADPRAYGIWTVSHQDLEGAAHEAGERLLDTMELVFSGYATAY